MKISVLFFCMMIVPLMVFAVPPVPDVQDSKSKKYIEMQNIQEAIKVQESRSSDGLVMMGIGILGDVVGGFVIQKSNLSDQGAGEAVIGVSSVLGLYGGWEFFDSQIQINPMRDEEIKILIQVN